MTLNLRKPESTVVSIIRAKDSSFPRKKPSTPGKNSSTRREKLSIPGKKTFDSYEEIFNS